jgi:hypothetical protein
MPAMRFRAADQIVEPAIAQAQVAMLKKTVSRVQQEIPGEHFGPDAEQQKWHGVQAEMQRLFDWVEAPDVERVQHIR